MRYKKARITGVSSITRGDLVTTQSAWAQLIATDRIHLVECQGVVAEKFLAQAQELYALLGSGSVWTEPLEWFRALYGLLLENAKSESDHTQALENYNLSWAEYSQVEKAYSLALDMYTYIQDGWGEANTLRRLGELYQWKQEYAEAKEAYSRALKIYTQLGDNHGQATTLLQLGDLYQWQSMHIEMSAQQLGWIIADIMKGLSGEEFAIQIQELLGWQVEKMKLEGSNIHKLDTIPYIFTPIISWASALEVFLMFHWLSENLDEVGKSKIELTKKDMHIAVLKWLHAICQQQSTNDPDYAALAEIFAKKLDTCTFYVPGGWDGLPGDRNFCQWCPQISEVETLLDLARAFYHQKARAAYIQASEIYVWIDNDWGHVKALLGLGKTQLHQGQHAEAKLTITDAAKISDTLKYGWGRNTSEMLFRELDEAELSFTSNHLSGRDPSRADLNSGLMSLTHLSLPGLTLSLYPSLTALLFLYLVIVCEDQGVSN